MKKITLLVACASFAISSVAQSVTFLPNWKKGDKKTFTIVSEEKEYENDTLIEEEIYTSDGSIEVIKEDKETYTVKIMYSNIAMQAAVEFYENIGEELKEYSDLELIYEVNKSNGEPDLINWKDAKDYMNESFDMITKVFEGIDDTGSMVMFAELAFAPIRTAFEDKETIQAYMHDEIGFLTDYFGTEYTVGDTLNEEEMEENPMNPGSFMSAATSTYLSNFNEKSKTCDINQTVSFDMSEFKEMIVGLMTMMMEAFAEMDSTGESEEDASEAVAEAEMEIMDFEMDVSYMQTVSLNYESGWPSKVVRNGEVKGFEPMQDVKHLNLIRSVTTLK